MSATDLTARAREIAAELSDAARRDVRALRRQGTARDPGVIDARHMSGASALVDAGCAERVVGRAMRLGRGRVECPVTIRETDLGRAVAAVLAEGGAP